MSQLAWWDASNDGPNLSVLAVNLSARQLDAPETGDTVRTVLERYGIAPARVELEITESAVMGSSTPARRSLAGFKELGIRVALDDFGTGCSSLAYLHSLPVTTVKVDRSFVERLGSTNDSVPVVEAIIEMSHAMGLRVVAEGVSSALMKRLVSNVGCDLAQGFYWAPPMRAEEFENWWQDVKRQSLAVARDRSDYPGGRLHGVDRATIASAEGSRARRAPGVDARSQCITTRQMTPEHRAGTRPNDGYLKVVLETSWWGVASAS